MHDGYCMAKDYLPSNLNIHRFLLNFHDITKAYKCIYEWQ